ncbi:glycosyltransferase family 4 protein [Bacillus sp. FJAT-49705]|uniref:Glycosyltransferase family 4 protein n=1 Tax=Cytobacillus citreus TaxID=2833586 RepID=A0ABS5P0H6_9BACI|nr:glycosyltransferase family 4 protein [Cytobacillus citreus]MBS4192694.1 glycosyltransferase family 4 protein [Cytobacillus citreus]
MRKILILNIFPIDYPPVSGGTLRYFHLYHKLSNYYDITLLSQLYRPHREKKRIDYSPTFREYQIGIESKYHRLINKRLQSAGGYELSLIKSVILSKYPTLFNKYFKTLYKNSDIIIHESPYLIGYDQYLGHDDKLRIYSSHNHEFALANLIWKNSKARGFLPLIYELEKKLVHLADLVFATSEQERESFAAMYDINLNKIKLAPNGINPAEWVKKEEKPDAKLKVFFIGANYPPNIEAVHFIIEQLADNCLNIDFLIAGGCSIPFQSIKKSNLKLLGTVDNTEKLTLFANADIAINPMFKGSGVNLKTLEFLSAGIPLFSTQCGVRGLNLIDKQHYIHAEKENFAERLIEFSCKKELLKKISLNGQKYINDHYSWGKIAQNMQEEIEHMINQKNRHG